MKGHSKTTMVKATVYFPFAFGYNIERYYTITSSRKVIFFYRKKTEFSIKENAHRTNSDTIETVRKERVFDSEITEDEMDIIAKRVALQQQQVFVY